MPMPSVFPGVFSLTKQEMNSFTSAWVLGLEAVGMMPRLRQRCRRSSLIWISMAPGGRLWERTGWPLAVWKGSNLYNCYLGAFRGLKNTGKNVCLFNSVELLRRWKACLLLGLQMAATVPVPSPVLYPAFKRSLIDDVAIKDHKSIPTTLPTVLCCTLRPLAPLVLEGDSLLNPWWNPLEARPRLFTCPVSSQKNTSAGLPTRSSVLEVRPAAVVRRDSAKRWSLVGDAGGAAFLTA